MLCVDRLHLLERCFVLDWANLDGTSQNPDASEVDVSLIPQIVESEALEKRKRIVIGVIVMPLEALRVVEDNVAWKAVVSVDDVCEEDVGFAAFILCHSEGVCWVVHNVDALVSVV